MDLELARWEKIVQPLHVWFDSNFEFSHASKDNVDRSAWPLMLESI